MIDDIRPNCSEDRHDRTDWHQLVDRAAVFAQDGAIKGFAVAIGIAGYNDEVKVMAAGPPADRERLLVAIVKKELGPVRLELHDNPFDSDADALLKKLGVNRRTLRQFLPVVDRECQMRQRVYPRRVAEGRMSQSRADQELQTMTEIGDLIQSLIRYCNAEEQGILQESA